ncbi:hypothetical protein FSP39_018690 [Pinctada imbricata]|uniref:VWFA domain-containing protein n=1 Tax=Pinctada imbricata TaxID=66713 RepID=A0AA88Y894_PINIB|nr:hypothetical protein FSP39_018690 [Pinctada imbricata]
MLGYVVCENNGTTIQNFHPYMDSTLEQLRTVSQNNASSSRREKCISSLRRLFKESGRHEVVQIALMIIAHQDHWNDDHTLSEAKAMKQKGITLLVVTIGRRNFKELHSLRSIATSDDKFFVLPSFEDLKKLASDLSTGSCLRKCLNLSIVLK